MEKVAFFFGSRYLPDLIVLVLVLIAQVAGLLLILRGPAARAPLWARRTILLCAAASAAAVMFAFLLMSSRVSGHFPSWWAGWGRGLAISWAILSVLWTAAYALSRALSHSIARMSGEPADPARRNFLRLARAALF